MLGHSRIVRTLDFMNVSCGVRVIGDWGCILRRLLSFVTLTRTFLSPKVASGL